MRRTLWTVQPLDMPQPSTDLSVLHLGSGELLLLLGLELHIAFGLALDGGLGWRALGRRRSRADDTARHAGSGPGGVVEAVESDGQVSLLRQAAVGYVPLLRAEGANEFFVVGNHDYTALVIADGDCETAEGVTVQKVGWFVEHEKMRVVLLWVSFDVKEEVDRGEILSYVPT